MNCKTTSLFPSELNSESVKDQTGLDAALAKYSQWATPVIWMAVCKPEIRQWYEKNWPKVKKYLDRDFVNKFRSKAEHDARAWEFHLAVALLDHGILLKEKNWVCGPDFCINLTNDKRLWIEAIACTLGQVDPVEPHPDLKPGVIYSFGGNIEDDNRPRVLRITGAIGEKFEKYKDYLKNPEKSSVSEQDYLIIAVNGYAIQHFADPEMLFKRAVLGQGPDMLIRKGDKFIGGFYQASPTVVKKTKKGDQKIPSVFMEMDEFSPIGAVIYCGHKAYNCEPNGHGVGDDFLFAYHSNPNNAIPTDIFKFGRALRKNPKTGTITDSEQL